MPNIWNKNLVFRPVWRLSKEQKVYVCNFQGVADLQKQTMGHLAKRGVRERECSAGNKHKVYEHIINLKTPSSTGKVCALRVV